MMYKALLSDSQSHGQHLAELVSAPKPALVPVACHSHDHPYPSSPQAPLLCTHIHRAGIWRGFPVAWYCSPVIDWETGLKGREGEGE